MATLTYSKQNGYQVPNLRMDEVENEPQTLGRFGRAREKYLMEHRKGLYNSMLLTGRLWAHLTEIDWTAQEQMDNLIRLTGRNEEGLLADRIQLSGMSDFALDHLTVLEGDLSKLYEDGGRYVAAVYSDDDYGNPEMDSHWARLGDTVTIRYVEEYEYYNPDTGEVYGPWENVRWCQLGGPGGEVPGRGSTRWPPW